MKTNLTLQVLLFTAGVAALAQSPGPVNTTANAGIFASGSTATLLVDGRVLLVGGANAALYDSQTGKLAATTGSRTYSSALQSATLLPDGRVRIAGGSPFVSPPPAEWEIFDPVTGAFAVSGLMSFGKA